MSAPSQDAPLPSSTQAANAEDSLVRSVAIASLFTKDGDTYKCVVGTCSAHVACFDGRGCPGRLQHLKNHHADAYKNLPGKRAYKRARVEDSKNDAAKDPAVETGASQRKQATIETGTSPSGLASHKKHRGEATCVTVDMLIDFVCRTGLPFRICEDPFIRTALGSVAVGRKALPALLEKRAHSICKQFGELRLPIAIAIDGGTNQGTKTQNIVVITAATARLVGASRLESFTTANQVESLDTTIQQHFAGSPIVGFVSDNEQATTNCCYEVAAKYGGLVTTCACHCLNLIVKKVIMSWQDCNDAKAIVDACRVAAAADKALPSIPNEIDTRWNCGYFAAEIVVNKWAEFVARGVATKEDTAKVTAYVERLRPFLLSSRKCERDAANLWTAVGEYCDVLFGADGSIVVDTDFTATFRRNIANDALLSAIALHPDTQIDALSLAARLAMFYTLREQVKQAARAWKKPLPEDADVCNEVRRLLNGHLQAAFRLRVASPLSVDQYWAGLKEEMPNLWLLFTTIGLVPASSASVERSFSDLSFTVTALRTRMSEESIQNQLVVRSFLEAEAEQHVGWDHPKRIDTQKLVPFANEMCSAHCALRAKTLEVNDKVTVFYTTKNNGNKEVGYRAVLLQKEGSLWACRWVGAKEQGTFFDPSIDLWAYTNDLKIFEAA